jgi:hypothetical protein
MGAYFGKIYTSIIQAITHMMLSGLYIVAWLDIEHFPMVVDGAKLYLEARKPKLLLGLQIE